MFDAVTTAGERAFRDLLRELEPLHDAVEEFKRSNIHELIAAREALRAEHVRALRLRTRRRAPTLPRRPRRRARTVSRSARYMVMV